MELRPFAALNYFSGSFSSRVAGRIELLIFSLWINHSTAPNKELKNWEKRGGGAIWSLKREIFWTGPHLWLKREQNRPPDFVFTKNFFRALPREKLFKRIPPKRGNHERMFSYKKGFFFSNFSKTFLRILWAQNFSLVEFFFLNFFSPRNAFFSYISYLKLLGYCLATHLKKSFLCFKGLSFVLKKLFI